MLKKLLDKISFWIWHKNVAVDLTDNPLGKYLWSVRVETVYKPLFEKGGWEAVAEEHNRYVENLKKRPPDAGVSVK